MGNKSIIKVDENKCIGCALCMSDCPNGHFFISEGVAKVHDAGCLECGHCYAICPQKAISMDGYVEMENEECVSMTEFDSDKLLQAMKSRRSIRKFNDKPVEQEKIDKILEAGRYCPTAKNDQDVSYIILGSKQKEIEEHCMKLLNKGLNIAKKVSSTVRSLDIKDDFFFKNAPLVIVVVSKSKINGGLASSYMELMAESLGLGVLYSGFFQAFASASGKVKKLMNLPKGYKIISCLVIGYHDKKYLRIPPRKSLQSKEN